MIKGRMVDHTNANLKVLSLDSWLESVGRNWQSPPNSNAHLAHVTECKGGQG